MKAQIQKWGNSLAVRIPKSFADEVGLAAETVIELTIHEGQLLLTPVQPATYSLDDLLAKITDANRHDEVDSSAAIGNEVW